MQTICNSLLIIRYYSSFNGKQSELCRSFKYNIFFVQTFFYKKVCVFLWYFLCTNKESTESKKININFLQQIFFNKLTGSVFTKPAV